MGRAILTPARAVALASVLSAAACVRGGGSYRCSSDTECVFGGASGQCESVGFCSFPDPGCDSGFRYGVHSGAYANDCVMPGNNGFVSIGGAVTGLIGTNLVLRNNGSDDLLISADGAFTFETLVMSGVPYEVTVAAQPSNPQQDCGVAMGAGVAPDGNVTDVAVTCATETFTLGGIVVGLSNPGLVLTVNGGDDLPVGSSGGAFTFATPLPSGQDFTVAVKTQPSNQTCVVSGGTGTIGAANVTSVIVNCQAGTYTVGGMVSGLEGSAVLRNNGSDSVTVSANGSFAFPTPLTTSSSYAVTVLTQPSYPPRSQTCSVSMGTGTVGTANVTSVLVGCATNSFTVGGMVSGLSGTLVLQNGSDMLSITQSGSFTFPTAVLSGNTYNVTIMTQPSGQTCQIAGAAGTVGNANVTDVILTCGGGSGSDPGILCGTFYCDPAAGELCCIDNGTPTCASACNGGGKTPIRCDDYADCVAQGSPTTVCCGSINGDTVNAIYCGGASQCKMGVDAYYCDPNVANPCPHGGTCTATMYPFPGYYRCY